MIDVESIIIAAFISALIGFILRKITGVDIVGLISTVIVVSVVLYFVYVQEPSLDNLAAFVMWGASVIISLTFEEVFSGLISRFSGEKYRYR